MKNGILAVIGVLIIAFMGWYFYGTSSQAPPQTQKIQPEKQLRVATILERFYKGNRNWNNNDLTRDEATKALNDTIIKAGTQGLYDGIPFKLIGVANTTDKGYPQMAAFDYDKGYKEIHRTMEYSARLFALLPKGAADTLVGGAVYYIYGKTVWVSEPAEVVYKGVIKLPTIRVKADSIIVHRNTN